MPSRPVYRVATAGLDPRDVRLIEIVFKHSQYNRFGFVLEPRLVPETVDILIVNPFDDVGLRAVARLRTAGRDRPVVSAMPRGATGSARYAMSIDRLTLQLLPILNRVVEMELLAGPHARSAPVGAPVAGAGAASGSQPPAATATTGSPGAPGSAGQATEPTRELLREAARLSRAADDARLAAARQAQAAAGPTNLVPFPLGPESSSPQIRVLVVDDSPTVRKQLSIAFARMGVACDAATSAAEAMQRLAAAHYDLALVDVVMPEVDGYALTRQIRRAHRGMPVIILTSRSSPFDLARGALAGCSSYLVKPVPLKQLEAAIVKQLRRSLAIDDLRGMIRLSGDPEYPRAAGGSDGGDATRAPRKAGE